MVICRVILRFTIYNPFKAVFAQSCICQAVIHYLSANYCSAGSVYRPGQAGCQDLLSSCIYSYDRGRKRRQTLCVLLNTSYLFHQKPLIYLGVRRNVCKGTKKRVRQKILKAGKVNVLKILIIFFVNYAERS